MYILLYKYLFIHGCASTIKGVVTVGGPGGIAPGGVKVNAPVGDRGQSPLKLKNFCNLTMLKSDFLAPFVLK